MGSRHRPAPSDELLRSSTTEILGMHRRLVEIAQTLEADEAMRLTIDEMFEQLWGMLRIPLVECAGCGRNLPGVLATEDAFEFYCDQCVNRSITYSKSAHSTRNEQPTNRVGKAIAPE